MLEQFTFDAVECKTHRPNAMPHLRIALLNFQWENFRSAIDGATCSVYTFKFMPTMFCFAHFT